MNKPISLIMILLVWEIVGFGAIQPGRLIHVPNIKGIFSITVSPVGSEVLFYGSRDELEGEILSGSLFRLNLNSQKFSVVHINATQASNPTTPVWQADGSAAFFQCDDGIYKLYSNNIIPKLIWRGIAEGMAISKNEKFLAFWKIEDSISTLIVLDIKNKKEIRSWRLPLRFESDKIGWNLAFSQDDQILYARTFDEASKTPLKSFNITNAKIEIIEPNCLAVSQNNKATYYIAELKHNRILKKIIPYDTDSKLIINQFNFDCLVGGENSRWITAKKYSSKETVIIDS